MLPGRLTVVYVRIFLLLKARQVSDQSGMTWEGSPAMHALKQAVYGSASSTASLSELLYSASVQQVSLLPCLVAIQEHLFSSACHLTMT